MANQSRILDEQVQRLTRGLGNLLLPILHKMMPLLNAILMVITEIINALALLVGYDPSEYDYFGEIDESVIDLSMGLGTATENAKALKQQLRSFDKLNVITTPTNTGANTGAGGGIDPKILEMFNKASDDYMNSLMDVEMKATKIRDRIMEWLGFTKQVDAETGKVSFKFDHITGGTVLGALAVGGFIYSGIKNIFGILKKIGLLKFTNVKDMGKTLTSKVGKNTLLGSLTTLKNVAGGVGLLFTIATSYDSMYKLAEGTKTAVDAVGELNLSMLGAIGSGALLGSNFGALGAIIGATAGGIASLTAGLVGYINKTNEIEVANRVFDNQGISIVELGKKYTNMFNEADIWTEKLTTLKNAYETTNAKVKETKDGIALFKTELTYQDEAITNSQIEELDKKYDNLIKQTKLASQATLDYGIELINTYKSTSDVSGEETAKKIADLKSLSSAQEGYQIEYINGERELTKQYATGKISLTEYNKKIDELKEYYGLTAKSSFDAKGAIDNFNSSVNTEINYESPKELEDIIGKVSDKYNSTVDTLNKRKSEVSSYWDDRIEEQQTIIDNYDKTLELGGTLDEKQTEIYNNAKATLEKYKNNKKEAIAEINNTITTISGSYKGFLASVYTDLVNDGTDTSKEFNKVMSTIESDLNKVKDIDMSDFGKKMFDGMLKSVDTSKASNLKKLTDKFGTFGIDAGDSFTDKVKSVLESQETFGKIEKSADKIGEATAGGYQQGLDTYIKKYEPTKKTFDNEIKVCKDTLGVHSPSTVFEEIGENVILGFVNGLDNKSKDLLEATNKLLTKLKEKFEKVSLSINISTSVESSFNSILYKLELFTSKFRTGINKLLANMTTAMNNVRVGSDNKLYYTSMPYINVPRFKQGLDYVPKDYYLAYLDEGERVLTKQQNKEYTSSLQNGNNNKTIVSPTIIVQVGDEVVARKVLNNLEDIAKDNGKPITIGGY